MWRQHARHISLSFEPQGIDCKPSINLFACLFKGISLSTNHKFHGLSGEVGDVKNLPDLDGMYI